MEEMYKSSQSKYNVHVVLNEILIYNFSTLKRNDNNYNSYYNNVGAKSLQLSFSPVSLDHPTSS